MDTAHFTVVITDGTMLDFNAICNEVDYTDSTYCVFKHEERKSYTVLAIIPHDKILYITNEGVDIEC